MTTTGSKKNNIIITGGGGGIGKQTALRFASEGANLCITDINEELVKSAVEEIKASGGRAVGVTADASERKEAARVVKCCVDTFGSPTVLVNSAGIYKDRYFAEMTDDEWDETMRVNLGSVYAFCRECVGLMIEEKYGRIISLSSQAGISGSIEHSHYAASKAAIIGLTCSLARELAQYNINVHCIAPGIINTNMTAGNSPERRERFLRQIPLGRFGTPDEVAGIICFLASEDANYMTGQTINVTGGWLMHS